MTRPSTIPKPRLIARSLVLAIFACSVCLVCWTALGAGFTATLDQPTVAVGESATLSLSFEGSSPAGAPDIPSQPNLNISYAGQQNSITMINGRTTSTTIYQYSVTPQQPGEYTIPQFSAKIGNENLTTAALKLTAVKPAELDQKIAFVKIVTPKNEVYIGEIFPVEIRLYLAAGRGRPEQMPQLNGDGFTFTKINQPTQEGEVIENRQYAVVIFKTAAVAAKTGDLSLGPVALPVVLYMPQGNRQRRSAFDLFDGDFDDLIRGRREQKRVTLTGDAKQIKVLPLPVENVPPSFAGAVGQFSMTASVGPTDVSVGDPITVKLNIKGRGALDSVKFPDQAGWREFKTYPPTSTTTPGDALGLMGVKSFEQIVAPENPEVKSLPPLLFSYFDPDARVYRTLTHPATPLAVRPAAAAPAQPTVLADTKSSNEPAPAKDIVHIKTSPGAWVAAQPPLVFQPWFLALQGLPLLAFLAAYGRRKRSEHLANNPRLVRRRQVDQLVRNGLQDLRRFAKAGQSEEFFVAAFRLLQERLGERLDLPAAAITEAVVEERLRPRRVDGNLLSGLTELFQACNQARYAPVRSHEQLASLRERLETTLNALDKLDIDVR